MAILARTVLLQIAGCSTAAEIDRFLGGTVSF